MNDGNAACKIKTPENSFIAGSSMSVMTTSVFRFYLSITKHECQKQCVENQTSRKLFYGRVLYSPNMRLPFFKAPTQPSVVFDLDRNNLGITLGLNAAPVGKKTFN